MANCMVRRQDMPPPGGYNPIPFKRVPAKKLLGGYTMFALYAGVTAGAMYLYNLTYKKITRHEIELRSSKMAIYPMLLAERDREYLKQLRRNRDAEFEIMHDVPGWVTTYSEQNVFDYGCGKPPKEIKEVVGTWYGERIYKCVPPDYLVEPSFYEYYVHADPHEFFRRAFIKLRS